LFVTPLSRRGRELVQKFGFCKIVFHLFSNFLPEF